MQSMMTIMTASGAGLNPYLFVSYFTLRKS